MLYLLDANTLIDAKRDYYPMQRVPEFWDWLVHHGENGNIKIPIEIYEEFFDKKDSKGNKDALAEWAELEKTKNALILDEEADMDAVSRVTYGEYLPNPTDEDIQKIGRDPFLISYALRDKDSRYVVTTEISKPSRKGANRHVPDVCDYFGIRHINTFSLANELNFTTNWESLK